jgi:hypothetical protein
MEALKINNRSQLLARIKQLESRRDIHEKLIVEHSSEIYGILSRPGPIIKQTIHELAEDTEFKTDAIKFGINIAASYLGNRIANRNTSKMSIVNMAIEAITSEKGEENLRKLKNWFVEFFTRNKNKESHEDQL